MSMAWAVSICKESAQESADVRPVRRSYHDVEGRPDADDWYAHVTRSC